MDGLSRANNANTALNHDALGHDALGHDASGRASDGFASRFRRWLQNLDQHNLTAAAIFACLYLLNFLAPTDPDSWWHLRTGQYIVDTGVIPNQDIFSYTALGQPWIAHEWLAEVLMHLVYATGGYVTLVAVFSLIITLAYFFLYRLLTMFGVQKIMALVLVLWTVIVRFGLWSPRPQLFTFTFFAIFLYLLFAYKQNSEKRLWLMPPIMVLWVNLHAGYVIGLFLIGLFIVGEGLNVLTGRPAARLRPLITVAIVSFFATIINPHTYQALLYPFTYVGTGNASMRFINEWQSPDFHLTIYLGMAITIAALMVIGRRERLDFTRSLLLVAFTLMALQSVRHLLLFALVAAVIIGWRLKDVLPKSDAAQRRWTTTSVVLSLLLVLMPVILAVAIAMSPRSQAQALPDTQTYPVGGVAYLQEHKPAGNLFNDYNWGGYLIYTLYPEQRVFVDGRADVYGDSFIEEYMIVNTIKPGWREVLDRYDITTALVKNDSALAVLLDSQQDWRLAYEGDVEKIFVRGEDVP